ncbi:rubredoxin [Ectothiorhodospira shaposhnikovii]|uniref:rubredoxin n=1 Tax=Ectothiorhodospira shaposhnikovii TaxID=1054 RepID=UPI0019047F88|nr:rubredoxin [Ectothiorhodospira shaposhnikovii]
MSDMTAYECRICQFCYDPREGDIQGQIPAGTPYMALPEDWFCPVCGAGREVFMPAPDAAS